MAAMNAREAASRARRVVRSRRFLLVARFALAGAALAAVAARVGAGPFQHGLLSLRPSVALAAIALAFLATAAAAWRWHVVARELGVAVAWPRAVAMYYRSQLLNTVLPGGVLGDVHRALDHGRSTERPGRAAHAVAGERIAGQLVQLVLTVVVLLAVGGAFGGVLFPAIGGVLATAAVVALVAALLSARVRRVLRAAAGRLRSDRRSSRALVEVAAASVVVVACHVATVLLAAAAVGVRLDLGRMLALAVVVLCAASIPVNLGGWGPREGVAAWAFAVGGSTASLGVSAATLVGVLAVVSVVPGVLVAALVPLIVRRTSRVRASLRDRELRHLPRRLPRLGRPAAAGAVQRGGLRPGG
ncbi:UPF0104 family protein [Leifsonia sp. ku-ls]|nr:UPF0104 family protein [Leifsonia sp. ku-ls]